jgi:N6-L-threonylcarbamoyladenine synthase
VPVRILAIESSCDETAAAVCADGIILSNEIATQTVHQNFGGVVPELASRAHMQHIVPVVEQALRKANVTIDSIDAFAYTQSPGLIGSLLVGGQFAKSLALSLGKPLIAVHHMQAHVLANLIEHPDLHFPFLCLTVSGGHTQLVKCVGPIDMKVIGETIDDAAGEAFDKTAKLLGLPYPGGPLIDRYAQQGRADRFVFPEPQIADLNFSFSGLKTSILYFLQNAGKSHAYHPELIATPQEQRAFIEANLADLCASIQQRIVSILLHKLKKAVVMTGIKNIALAGGVSANSGLRNGIQQMAAQYHYPCTIPSLAYCTDNAAMIAITGYYKYLDKQFAPLDLRSTAKATW